MYAVIDDRGTQIKVSPGDVLDIDVLPGNGRSKDSNKQEQSQSLMFDRVLLVSDPESGGPVSIGTPYVEGASVSAEVVEQVQGEKLDVLMYKRRKGQRRKIGHRQKYLRVKITAINS